MSYKNLINYNTLITPQTNCMECFNLKTGDSYELKAEPPAPPKDRKCGFHCTTEQPCGCTHCTAYSPAEICNKSQTSCINSCDGTWNTNPCCGDVQDFCGPPTQKPPICPPTQKPPICPPTQKPPICPPTQKPPICPPTQKPTICPPTLGTFSTNVLSSGNAVITLKR